ncbi:FG-GAP repeat domain-containing protein [Arenibacter palladensis]|uniref:FG-GAP repeat domain-containing protein n=1 Tax=Arenibacter palladensis TaxID=237373 RepID=UPI0026E19C7D|nr:VCBS repeat-containing protein [Arenibacter palladensis]MDO6602606.1 VCBS repeat-containing protein [Arenibacter palladensis]
MLLRNRIYILSCFLLLPLGLVWSQVSNVPSTAVSFDKIELLDKYVSEGASIGDIDRDGHVDILAGNLWWKGPDFKVAYAYGPVKYFPITGPGLEGYSTNFFTFPSHIDGNRWIDILQVGLPGTDSKWIKDPGKNSLPGIEMVPEPVSQNALGNVCHESPDLVDIIRDKQRELLAFSKGYLVLGLAPSKKGEDWQMLPISVKDEKKFIQYSHGLGAGDINGDGLTDVIERSGWWEQPKNWDRTTPWAYHPFPFSPGKGGAQMFAYDLDGDGDNDVVTAKDGHGYGLSWFEQIVEGGEITFKEHIVMTNSPEDNPYGVSFSQLHAMSMTDIDKDGIPDIVTGKCYYAHNGRDPGAEDPAVLYWFKTQRNADGSAELVPYRIDDNSGVGRQITTGDLNGDGKMDIVTSNKKGVYAFIQK